MEQPPKKRRRRRKGQTDKVGADFDWKTLNKGDLIKVCQGSGPYYEGLNEFGQPVKECMSDAGWYSVHSVDLNGIHAYDSYGHSYLYMGPENQSPSGIIRSPHKILRVKRHSEGQLLV